MSIKRKLDEFSEDRDEAAARSPPGLRLASDSSKTYRMTNIPLLWTISNIYEWLQVIFGISEFDDIHIRTLAINYDRRSKVATMSLRERPGLLDEASTEWHFPATSYTNEDTSVPLFGEDRQMIRIDDHFHGFTVLRSHESGGEYSNPSQVPLDGQVFVDSHQIDLVAISGLGGHAFGSFKERKGSHMWLADALPKHLPGARILIYGYDTKLEANTSFQSFEGLASAFRLKLHLARQGCEDVPLVFLAHSLGGIVVKEALIQLWRDQTDQRTFNAIYGMIFFGVPSLGMDIGSLIPIVDGQPNEFMLHALGTESPALRAQRRDFNELIQDRELELFCFFESSLSPTAIRVNGELKMAGPLTLLVGSFSATDGAPDTPQHIQELKRDHSRIVKFSNNDDDYQVVLQVLKRFHGGAIHSGIRPLTVEEQACLRTLSFPEMNKRRLTIGSPLTGTCHWLCEKAEYRAWLQETRQKNQVLWIKGKPGAGKSTLIKHVLKCLESKQNTKSTYAYVGLASFFFNARGADLERDASGMFRSLLHQLFQSLPALRNQVMKEYNKKKETMTTWSWHREELQHLLTSIVSSPPRYEITIFIDAFDECENSIEAWNLVQYLMDLPSAASVTGVKLRICLSSRHYPNFPDRNCPQIWVEDNNHGDIETYIRSQIGENQALEAKHEGVFLWVVLTVPEIARKMRGLTSKNRRKLISQLPKELDDVYRHLLGSVKGNDDDQTVAIMRWILFSFRPLRLSELRHALGFGSSSLCKSLTEWQRSDDFIESNEKMYYVMQDLSGGLLENRDDLAKGEDHRDPNADLEVQFIHESARDFLVHSNGLRQLGFTETDLDDKIHEELKRACIRYLTMEDLQCGYWDLEEDFSDFPFLDYSCQNLLLHASSAEAAGVPQDRIFQELSILNEKTSCWRITKAGVGSVVAQGRLSTIFALQGEILAILEDAERFGLTTYTRLPMLTDLQVVSQHQSDGHVAIVGVQVDRRAQTDFVQNANHSTSSRRCNTLNDFLHLMKHGLDLVKFPDFSSNDHTRSSIIQSLADVKCVLTGRKPILSSGTLGVCVWADYATEDLSKTLVEGKRHRKDRNMTISLPHMYGADGYGQPTPMPNSTFGVEDPMSGRSIPQIVVTMDQSVMVQG